MLLAEIKVWCHFGEFLKDPCWDSGALFPSVSVGWLGTERPPSALAPLTFSKEKKKKVLWTTVSVYHVYVSKENQLKTNVCGNSSHAHILGIIFLSLVCCNQCNRWYESNKEWQEITMDFVNKTSNINTYKNWSFPLETGYPLIKCWTF